MLAWPLAADTCVPRTLRPGLQAAVRVRRPFKAANAQLPPQITHTYGSAPLAELRDVALNGR